MQSHAFTVIKSAALSLAVALMSQATLGQCKEQGFGPFDIVASWGATTTPRICDLNLDGVPDILLVHEYADGEVFPAFQVLLGRGDGTFDLHRYDVPPGRKPMLTGALGDLNGDGFPDVILTKYSPATIDTYLNDGTGRFASPTIYTVDPSHDPVSSLQTADINGDGQADVLYVRGISVFLRLSQEDGTLDSPIQTNAVWFNEEPVSVADVNADGRVEIVSLHNGIHIWFDDGTGTFPDERIVTSQQVSGQFVDVNGDGYLDIATSRSAEGNTIYENRTNDGKGNFSLGPSVSRPSNGNGFLRLNADVDADGDLDIILSSRDTLEWAVYLNNGDEPFSGPFPLTGTSIARNVIAADFTGDGRADLIGPLFDQIGVAISRGRGDGTFGPWDTCGDEPAHHFRGYWNVQLADLNGDGLMDAVINTAYGDFYPDNETSVALGVCPCPADFNHDGIVSSQDFFDFLAAFFVGAPEADLNADGAVTSNDFFDFLGAFFQECE